MTAAGKSGANNTTAWLIADRLNGGYLCSWYADHLVEQSRASTAADAVAWGRQRTPRVQIRTEDACSYWAGTAPRPATFTRTWADPAAGKEPAAS